MYICRLLFFGYISLLSSNAVPFDRHVVAKEKAAKYYKLSAYFLAKVVVEMSFICLLTSLLYIPLFFIAGLKGVGAFFGTYLTVILHCLTVQVSIRGSAMEASRRILYCYYT